jgi:hypothetical protein
MGREAHARFDRQIADSPLSPNIPDIQTTMSRR